MKTPICDFIKDYAAKDPSRFHMPGHKGVPFLGCEPLDVTEICGADVLYSPDGIIAESEKNAAALFGSLHTFYSTEGSTLAIKAMLGIASMQAVGRRPLILAARNAHRSFVHACALLDLDVCWMIPEERSHLCSCDISPQRLEYYLRGLSEMPCAVYVTSPDYLGNVLDIASLSEICHAHGVPLLVDNAHGAYLAFTDPRLHPIALGADACCDSAHKTLPVLTGGAYLHISEDAPPRFKEPRILRNTLSIFASTSPSYLILQSLDLCNKYLSDGYSDRLRAHIDDIAALKSGLTEKGFSVIASEPLKTVISAGSHGYSGEGLASILRAKGIECEFADAEHIVFMSTPENSREDLRRLYLGLTEIPPLAPISVGAGVDCLPVPRSVTSIRRAIFGPRRTVPADGAAGHVCASPSVSCPPAVPIVVSGEIITEEHVRLFKAYGISTVEICDLGLI